MVVQIAASSAALIDVGLIARRIQRVSEEI